MMYVIIFSFAPIETDETFYYPKYLSDVMMHQL